MKIKEWRSLHKGSMIRHKQTKLYYRVENVYNNGLYIVITPAGKSNDLRPVKGTTILDQYEVV